MEAAVWTADRESRALQSLTMRGPTATNAPCAQSRLRHSSPVIRVPAVRFFVVRSLKAVAKGELPQ
jgi:hypothetical protein